MAQDHTGYRNIMTRALSTIALFAVCGFGVVGASAVLLGASSTAALAHGGGGHGGGGGGHGAGAVADFMAEVDSTVVPYGGHFRGGGVGIGFWGPGYYYPDGYSGYYGDERDLLSGPAPGHDALRLAHTPRTGLRLSTFVRRSQPVGDVYKSQDSIGLSVAL